MLMDTCAPTLLRTSVGFGSSNANIVQSATGISSRWLHLDYKVKFQQDGSTWTTRWNSSSLIDYILCCLVFFHNLPMYFFHFLTNGLYIFEFSESYNWSIMAPYNDVECYWTRVKTYFLRALPEMSSILQ